MIGYNPSHLNKNETLLEAFHRVEAYLKANPQYQVYQSSVPYQEYTDEYTLNSIVVPEGSTVSVGDVVFFSNSYYAVIAAVYELTFSVETAVSFRGPQGPKGDKGDRGTGGAGSNPNLLINPNFAINQRGQTSYTSAGYTVDRWNLKGSGATVTTTSKGIRLTSTNSWQGLSQYIENYKQLDGQTVTLSVKVSATADTASKVFVFGLRDNDEEIVVSFPPINETAGIYTVTTTIPAKDSRTQLFVFLWSRYADEVFDIEWAKLEIGSVATEFSPPSIAEELPKCQRYYRKYLGGINGISLVGEFYAANTNAGFAKIYLGNMRSKPTMAISNVADIKIGFSTATFESTTVNTIQYNDITKDMSICKAYVTGTGFVAGQAYFLGIAKDGYIAFDAEL